MTFRESGAIRKQNHLRDPAAVEASQVLARKFTPSHHGARARAASQPCRLSAAMPAPFMEAFRHNSVFFSIPAVAMVTNITVFGNFFTVMMADTRTEHPPPRALLLQTQGLGSLG